MSIKFDQETKDFLKATHEFGRLTNWSKDEHTALVVMMVLIEKPEIPRDQREKILHSICTVLHSYFSLMETKEAPQIH